MKSKIIKILYIIFTFLTSLQTGGIIDILPIKNENIKEWIKWSIAVLLIGLSIFFAEPIKFNNLKEKKMSATQANSYVKINIPSNVTLKYIGQFSTHVNKFTRVAVTTDNKIYTWGYNANFNIDGVTTPNCLMPIDVTPNCINK